MRAEYKPWLYQHFIPATASVKYSDLARIERAYGDLDEAYEQDGFASILRDLQYDAKDKAAAKENPSKVPIAGGLYIGLGSLRHALKQYRSFLDSLDQQVSPEEIDDSSAVEEAPLEGVEPQRFHLERDMQLALRRSLSQLEPGLQISDGGTEQYVPSGRIDISATDSHGARVVIELKAGRANRDAVVQTQSYMGDLLSQDTSRPVRGILVAQEFDPKAIAAARVVPTLVLKRYDIRFLFTDVENEVPAK